MTNTVDNQHYINLHNRFEESRLLDCIAVLSSPARPMVTRVEDNRNVANGLASLHGWLDGRCYDRYCWVARLPAGLLADLDLSIGPKNANPTLRSLRRAVRAEATRLRGLVQ